MTILKPLLTMAFALAFLPIANVEGALFPGPSPTLIDLYSRAELIVHARVVKTETKAGQLSRLQVLSVIKPDGRDIPDELNVFIQFGSNWPTLFKANSNTIAFLRFDDVRRMYVPINSVTGLHVDDEALGRFYIQQFAKLPEILGTKEPPKRLLREVEWYVELSLVPQTRTQGAYGLYVLWCEFSEAGRLNEDQSRSKDGLLTKAQKDRICRNLAKENPGNDAQLLLEILKDYPSRDLDHYLIQAFKRSLVFEESVPGLGDDMALTGFRCLPQRMGFDVPQDLQAKFETVVERRNSYVGLQEFDPEKAKARDDLIRLWRDVATLFLSIPKVENANTVTPDTRVPSDSENLER